MTSSLKAGKLSGIKHDYRMKYTSSSVSILRAQLPVNGKYFAFIRNVGTIAEREDRQVGSIPFCKVQGNF